MVTEPQIQSVNPPPPVAIQIANNRGSIFLLLYIKQKKSFAYRYSLKLCNAPLGHTGGKTGIHIFLAFIIQIDIY